MSGTFDHPNFRIVDDFLDEDTWTALWSDFQFMELHPVARAFGAWKLEDGVPLGGNEAVRARADVGAATPDRSPLEQVIAAIFESPDHHRDLVDDDWDRISARAYVYPHGTGLSWHVDDHELYAGAFIYYAHPHWNAHWGGELLIAESDPEAEGTLPIMAYRFETEPYSQRLLDMGVGHFVMPKPNRLVILSGAPHMIVRVNPAAGAAVRASVAGFFLRPQGAQATDSDD